MAAALGGPASRAAARLDAEVARVSSLARDSRLSGAKHLTL